MKLIMLGTGNATVTECYNTCFVLEDAKKYFLVDGGGGIRLLHQLKCAGIAWPDIREIFITHKHIDHLLGIVWMVRMILQNMSRGTYAGEAFIYGHAEVITLLENMAHALFSEKETAFIGSRLQLVQVKDGEEKTVIGHAVTFFDIGSDKARQFGFSMQLSDGERLVCCGDEPYRACEEKYARGCKWLMHEAFCLYSQADVFLPYQKKHSTVADACRTAQSLQVSNLVLYHTEDKNISQRKTLYTAEGGEFYGGNLYVPDDLETLEL